MKKLVLICILCIVSNIHATDFTVNGINYTGTDVAPYTAAVADNIGFVGAATIPSTVEYNGIAYGVTAIGNDAFRDCTGLTSIDLPDSITSIGDLAFLECTSLTSVDIPESVTTIGQGAFHSCTGLAFINLPDSVMAIGSNAFASCANLTSIDLPDSLTSIGWATFILCTSLTSIDLPDSVTAIGNYAFYYCTSLTSIDLPDSLTIIDDYAFRDCTGLASVSIANSTPISISSSVFEGVTANNVELIVPKGAKAAYEAASVWQDFNPITSITPDNISSKGLTASSGDIANSEVAITKPDALNTSISELTIGVFELYPNPVISELTINHNSGVKIDSIAIYNLNGALLIDAKHTNSIALSKLASGVYMVKIIAGNIQKIKKIIKN